MAEALSDIQSLEVIRQWRQAQAATKTYSDQMALLEHSLQAAKVHYNEAKSREWAAFEKVKELADSAPADV